MKSVRAAKTAVTEVTAARAVTVATAATVAPVANASPVRIVLSTVRRTPRRPLPMRRRRLSSLATMATTTERLANPVTAPQVLP